MSGADIRERPDGCQETPDFRRRKAWKIFVVFSLSFDTFAHS
jgi:hypothetical protein